MGVDVKYRGKYLGSVYGLIYVYNKLSDTKDKTCFRVNDLNALEVILGLGDDEVLQVHGKDMSFTDFKEKYLQYIPDIHFASVGTKPSYSLLAGVPSVIHFRAK